MKTDCTAKILELEALLTLREAYRRNGRTMVWTNGCFDLLHAGHVRSLRAASEFGDVLVIGLNSDDSVRQLKGPKRPILPERDRAEMLAALECVDHVVIFPDLTPIQILDAVRPDVHCKGMEYAPPRGLPIPEQTVIEAYGGRVMFLPLLPGISTTELIDRIRSIEAGDE